MSLLDFDWESLKQTLLQIESDKKDIQEAQELGDRVVKNKVKLLGLLLRMLRGILNNDNDLSFTTSNGLEIKLTYRGWNIGGNSSTPVQPEEAAKVSLEDLEAALIPFLERKVPRIAGKLLEKSREAGLQKSKLQEENEQILKLLNLIELLLDD